MRPFHVLQLGLAPQVRHSPGATLLAGRARAGSPQGREGAALTWIKVGLDDDTDGIALTQVPHADALEIPLDIRVTEKLVQLDRRERGKAKERDQGEEGEGVFSIKIQAQILVLMQ